MGRNCLTRLQKRVSCLHSIIPNIPIEANRFRKITHSERNPYSWLPWVNR